MILDKDIVDQLKSDIEHVLLNEYDWNVEEIQFANNGVVNAIYRVKEKDRGMLAVRIPWRIDDSTMNHDSADILSIIKESTLAEHCSQYGIPVPKIHKLYLSNEVNFLVSDFITGDNEPISSYEIGKLTSRIHRVPIEGLSIIDQKQYSLNEIVAKRIENRFTTVNQLLKLDWSSPPPTELLQILDSTKADDRLLHLDVRPANLIGKNGKIKAIFDWDNSYVGNPVMEFMRISECREVEEEEFLEGYGDLGFLHKTEKVIQYIYRLDTALMLTIVFTSFVQDPVQRDYYLKRVQYLRKEISKRL